jgi:hypothetical protein
MNPTQKQLKVDKVLGTTFYRIVYEGGGPAPAELQGSFTSQSKAESALYIYKAKMAARSPEEKPDSEKDILELLATKRPPGRPPNAGKRN